MEPNFRLHRGAIQWAARHLAFAVTVVGLLAQPLAGQQVAIGSTSGVVWVGYDGIDTLRADTLEVWALDSSQMRAYLIYTDTVAGMAVVLDSVLQWEYVLPKRDTLPAFEFQIPKQVRTMHYGTHVVRAYAVRRHMFTDYWTAEWVAIKPEHLFMFKPAQQ